MDSFRKKLSLYAAAAGTALLATTDASAAAITRTADASNPVVSYDLDVDGDTIIDYIISANFAVTQSSIEVAGGANRNEYVATETKTLDKIAALSPGGVVGPEATWSSQYPGVLADGGPDSGSFGKWNDGNRHFMGLRFKIDEKAHYGWADISAAITESSASFTVHDTGYQAEPDTAIAVVPEPSSLALMAVGAAGVLALKRRRASRS